MRVQAASLILLLRIGRGGGPDPRQEDPQGGGRGKLLSPGRGRSAVERAVRALGVSERRACRALGQHRSVQHHAAKPRPDEDALTADIVALASGYGRHGYRRVTALLRAAGWRV